MRQLRVAKLDGAAESVRQSHHDAIVELQLQPMAGAVTIRGIAIPNNGTVTKAHKLGRTPIQVLTSPPRGGSTPGLLGEVSRTDQVIVLSAAGFGAAITVDVTVF